MAIKIAPTTGDITEIPDPPPEPIKWHEPNNLPDNWLEKNRAKIIKRLEQNDDGDDRSHFVRRMTDPDWY